MQLHRRTDRRPRLGPLCNAGAPAAMEVEHTVSHRTVVDGPAGPLEIHVHGKGPAVVLLASLGRGADDFVDLAARLAAAGFCALALEPRGIGASSSPLEGVTMAGLADDVAA